MAKLVLAPARGVCEECLQNSKQTATNGLLIISYCLHNQAGAVMEIRNGEPSGIWKIYTPITAEEFADAIAGAVADVESMSIKFQPNAKLKTFKGN